MKSITDRLLSRKERQRFVKSVPTACDDAKSFYLCHVLPLFIEEIADNFECEFSSGCYLLPTTNEHYFVYATPFWEGHQGIPVSVVDDAGNYDEDIDLSFKLTYSPRKDAENYINVLKNAEKKLGHRFLFNGQG